MKSLEIKARRRTRRKHSIRKKILRLTDRHRLTIYKSLNHIYGQIVDDTEGKTIVSASSIDKDIKGMLKPEMNKKKVSETVGTELAKRAKAKGIKQVAFDRNGFLFHGRIKAFADAVRKGGLEF